MHRPKKNLISTWINSTVFTSKCFSVRSVHCTPPGQVHRKKMKPSLPLCLKSGCFKVYNFILHEQQLCCVCYNGSQYWLIKHNCFMVKNQYQMSPILIFKLTPPSVCIDSHCFTRLNSIHYFHALIFHIDYKTIILMKEGRLFALIITTC